MHRVCNQLLLACIHFFNKNVHMVSSSAPPRQHSSLKKAKHKTAWYKVVITSTGYLLPGTTWSDFDILADSAHELIPHDFPFFRWSELGSGLGFGFKARRISTIKKKVKYVSCEFDQSNGRCSSLRAA